MRINDEQSVDHFWDCNEIAYWKSEGVYYDPRYNSYHWTDGDTLNPNEEFSEGWYNHAKFHFKTGRLCNIPQPDPNRRPKPQSKKRKSRNGNVVNFIKLDIISLCIKTDFNEADNPVTSWRKQQDCSFSIKSIVENRCMYWSRDIDGHCSCPEAYDHAIGNPIDLDRIDTIKEKDRLLEHPVDEWFEEAEAIAFEKIKELYDRDELKYINRTTGADVFYYPKWDVFFDGHGKLIKEMTRSRRKSNRDPTEFVREWQGPTAMEKQDNGMLIAVDNSGRIDPVEMHELLHNIQKIVKKGGIKEIVEFWDDFNE